MNTKKTFCYLLTFCSLMQLLLACSNSNSQISNPLQGTWSNETQGDVIGITFLNAQECSFFIERFLQNRKERDCQYAEEDGSILVYLINNSGSCSLDVDFKFRLDETVELLYLDAGQSEITMTKQDRSYQK